MYKPSLTNNTLRVKESNTNLILEALKNSEIATRTEIARLTGLSIATCGNILKDLVATGEILEGELENYNGGRPARQYVYNKNFSMVVAIALHSDKEFKTMQFAVTNLYGERLEEKVKAYNKIDVDVIRSLIGDLVKSYPNIKSVGIGIPGFISKNGSVGVSDIEELNGVDIVQILKDDFDLEIVLERSPSLSAYGFYKNNQEYKGKTLAAVLTPLEHPTGLGFVINGQIYKGNFNMEGEVSYIYGGYSKAVLPKDNLNCVMDEVFFSVASTIATFNPYTIVFMGKSFTKELFDEICDRCQQVFPEDFMPSFKLQDDYNDSYLEGAIQVAIDCLKPKVKLISK